MKSLLQFTSFYFDSKKNMAAIYSSYFLIDKLQKKILFEITWPIIGIVCLMVFGATFNNISALSLW